MNETGMQTITVNSKSGVATIVLDNGPVNLFDGRMFAELAAAIDDVAGDDSVRVLILSSSNPNFFIAHFDVTLLQRTAGRDLSDVEVGARAATTNPFHSMCEQLRTMPKATIAVIEGRVGGGGDELALSCDMRFALRGRAVFNQPEVALGIIPGGSGTVRLPRLIGRSRSLEAILGCDDVDADLAERWGWVNRTLDSDDLWPHVNRLAQRIASFPAHAVAAAKASTLLAESGISAHLAAESATFSSTLAEPVTQARMAAFMAAGGQTLEGESRIAAIAAEINSGG